VIVIPAATISRLPEAKPGIKESKLISLNSTSKPCSSAISLTKSISKPTISPSSTYSKGGKLAFVPTT